MVIGVYSMQKLDESSRSLEVNDVDFETSPTVMWNVIFRKFASRQG